MTESPLRWGIISAGRISNDFCIGLRSDPNKGHQIVAVAARDQARAAEFAKKHEILKSYSNYEDIAKDSSIEVVYIGTVNNEHFKVVNMLLNYNKNILCEKPLGMNVKETVEMIKLAKQKNVFFMEGMWARFFPVQVKIREELEKKSVGDVKLVIASFGYYAGEDMQRIFKKELGGGCLMDMGVYTIAFSQMVFGKMPQKITAVGYLNDDNVDEMDSVTLEYSGNRMSVFELTCKSEVPNEVIVCGTKGIIKINAPWWCSTSMVIKDKTVEFPLPHPVTKSHYDNGAGFIYEANEVKKCIRKGLKESKIVSHEDSLSFARIIEDCRKLVGVKYPQD